VIVQLLAKAVEMRIHGTTDRLSGGIVLTPGNASRITFENLW